MNSNNVKSWKNNDEMGYKKIEMNVETFDTKEDLFDDMYNSCQSFIIKRNECHENTNQFIIMGYSLYRHIECKKDGLYFRSNKYCGSEYQITGKIVTATKSEELDRYLYYNILIDGRKSPLVISGVKKNL